MNIKKIIAMFIAAAGITIGSALLLTPPSSQAQDLNVTGTLSGGEILRLLSDLNNIRLDPSLFSDPVFQSLKDYSVVIPTELVGRTNPFLPVGQTAAVATPSTVSGTPASAPAISPKK